jgi:SAM-dependent methyltransferase
MSEEQSKVLKSWDESGRYWEKYGQTIRAMFEPISRALMNAAQVGENHRVLDVAAGVGEPSLTIARTKASAEVWCTDAVWPMIEGARKEAARLALSNVRFTQCVSDALPFRDAFFDGAVCRFGVMFFPDPASGVREILRTLKPGGRTAFAVWGAAEANPFHYVVTDIISKYVPPKPLGPDDPGAFRFAPSGKLADVFKKAGASQVDEHVLRFNIEAERTPETFWQLRAEMSEANRDKIAKLSAGDKARLAAEATTVLSNFFSNGKMRFAAEVLVVTGSRK